MTSFTLGSNCRLSRPVITATLAVSGSSGLAPQVHAPAPNEARQHGQQHSSNVASPGFSGGGAEAATAHSPSMRRQGDMQELMGLRILALAAYRPPLPSHAAPEAQPYTSYHSMQLRCMAACMLAGVNTGPAGPHSLGAASLAAALQRADTSALWSLVQECSKSTTSESGMNGHMGSVEVLAMQALADGVALHAVHTFTDAACDSGGVEGGSSCWALRLDVGGLEAEAMRMAAAALPPGTCSPMLCAPTSATNNRTSTSSMSISSTSPSAETPDSASEHDAVPRTLSSDGDRLYVASACLAAWWPHEAALTAAAISIALQVPYRAVQFGPNRAQLKYVVEQMVLVSRAMGQPLAGAGENEQSAAACALLSRAVPYLTVEKEMVTLHVSALCEHVAVGAASPPLAHGTLRPGAGASSSSVCWPPDLSMLRPASFHPSTRRILTQLRQRLAGTDADVFAEACLDGIGALVSDSGATKGAPPACSPAAGYTSTAPPPPPPPPRPSDISDLQQLAQRAFPGRDDTNVMCRAVVLALSGVPQGPAGPHSMSGSTLGVAVSQRLQGNTRYKMRLIRGCRAFDITHAHRDEVNVRLDVAGLRQLAAQAAAAGTPASAHNAGGSETYAAAAAKGLPRLDSQAPPPPPPPPRPQGLPMVHSAPTQPSDSATLQHLAGQAFPGADDISVVCCAAAQVLGGALQGPAGEHSMTGSQLGIAASKCVKGSLRGKLQMIQGCPAFQITRIQNDNIVKLDVGRLRALARQASDHNTHVTNPSQGTGVVGPARNAVGGARAVPSSPSTSLPRAPAAYHLTASTQPFLLPGHIREVTNAAAASSPQGPPGASSSWQLDDLSAAAAVVYAGGAPLQVVQRVAAQATAAQPQGVAGPYSISGAQLGEALLRHARDAWQALPKGSGVSRVRAAFGVSDGILHLVPCSTGKQTNHALRLDPAALMAAAAAAQGTNPLYNVSTGQLACVAACLAVWGGDPVHLPLLTAALAIVCQSQSATAKNGQARALLPYVVESMAKAGAAASMQLGGGEFKAHAHDMLRAEPLFCVTGNVVQLRLGEMCAHVAGAAAAASGGGASGAAKSTEGAGAAGNAGNAIRCCWLPHSTIPSPDVFGGRSKAAVMAVQAALCGPARDQHLSVWLERLRGIAGEVVGSSGATVLAPECTLLAPDPQAKVRGDADAGVSGLEGGSDEQNEGNDDDDEEEEQELLALLLSG